jgi:YebC/PmpR family DNA-binding regulatory protein
LSRIGKGGKIELRLNNFESMSGHSKWHNIQARKGKQDAKKGNVFSKYAKKIAVAARAGGGSLDTNFSLRILVEKAKKEGMPKDNIERAIKAGTGELKDTAQVEELMYEGFGPGGTALMIQILTDNKNRTSPEIKKILADHGGSMGGAGNVQWMFGQWGMVRVGNEQLAISKFGLDDFEMQMMDAGAEDILVFDGKIEIKTKVENLQKVLSRLKGINIEPESSWLEWIAKDKVKVDAATTEKLQNLFGAMEEHDDVEDYFTNAE